MSETTTEDRRRAMTVVPTICTLLNLFLGWLAIVRAFDGRPAHGALLVLSAAILDKLDGYLARATDSSSAFGRELDSLADVVSFGVAPAMVATSWSLYELHRVGAAAAFLFTACGTLRLARFNVLPPASDKRWFVGLPIPMAAAVPMSFVVAHAFYQDRWSLRLEDRNVAWLFAALMACCALLMVSTVRYYAFKGGIGKRWKLAVLVFLAIITVICAWPEFALPTLAVLYGLHGPVFWILRRAGLRLPGPSPA